MQESELQGSIATRQETWIWYEFNVEWTEYGHNSQFHPGTFWGWDSSWGLDQLSLHVQHGRTLW